MVDRNVITAKLAELADRVARVRKHRPADADALARATGLRNVVAHVYAQADPEQVYRGASTGLDDLERFSREVAAWIEERSES